MEKYSWNFDEDAELWRNDTHETIEACIAEAELENIELHDGEYEDVYVAENVEYTPSVDGETVLDHIQEQAYDFAGEIGGDWYAYDHKNRDQLDELDVSLTAAVCEWMRKYGYYPEFYAIENITRYPLEKPCPASDGCGGVEEREVSE